MRQKLYWWYRCGACKAMAQGHKAEPSVCHNCGCSVTKHWELSPKVVAEYWSTPY